MTTANRPDHIHTDTLTGNQNIIIFSSLTSWNIPEHFECVGCIFLFPHR